jgi:hypothetical protein
VVEAKVPLVALVLAEQPLVLVVLDYKIIIELIQMYITQAVVVVQHTAPVDRRARAEMVAVALEPMAVALQLTDLRIQAVAVAEVLRTRLPVPAVLEL